MIFQLKYTCQSERSIQSKRGQCKTVFYFELRLVSTHCPYPIYSPPVFNIPTYPRSSFIGCTFKWRWISHCVIIATRSDPGSPIASVDSVIYALSYIMFGLIWDNMLWIKICNLLWFTIFCTETRLKSIILFTRVSAVFSYKYLVIVWSLTETNILVVF